MKKNTEPLSNYEAIPEGMRIYLSNYGRHFNRKMYEFAVSLMYGERTSVRVITKDEFNNKCSTFNIKLDNDVLYDGMFVYAMCASDFLGSSIIDEQHQMLYVKDTIDDIDQPNGYVFNRFYADCMLKGIPIDWESML